MKLFNILTMEGCDSITVCNIIGFAYFTSEKLCFCSSIAAHGAIIFIGYDRI